MASVHIVGAGVAGFSLAHTLIQQGYAGRITLSDPEGLPYDRPPLSKSLERVGLIHPGWFAEHSVTLEETSIASPEVPENEGDWLVLATGTIPRTLVIPGAEHARLLHSAADAEALAQKLSYGAFGTQVVMIGAGLIGAEFAAAARHFGAMVTLVSNRPTPMADRLGEPMARQLHEDHQLHGIRVITGTASKLTADSVEVAGEVIDADIIVAAIGVEPNLAVAQALGLATEAGILVNHTQTSSCRRVLAIGDAAQQVGQPLRMHWDAANEDARIAAATIMGTEAPQRQVPWFWSDRHETHVEVVGDFARAATTVERLNRRGRIQALFGLDASGRLVAASMVDGGQLARAVRKLIAQGASVPTAQLEDPSIAPRALGR